MNQIDLETFFTNFQDHLAPKLDAYEQAIYLYVFRHARFLGYTENVIGFKSARTRMALGVGQEGSPMSEGTVYKKLSSLEQKGCIKTLQTEHKGRRLTVLLPNEILGLIPEKPLPPVIDMESMDFFEVIANRLLILQREKSKCFYTLKPIDEQSFVAEHVISRPVGDNSYRNIVAASREANNRKGSLSAEDFFRRLFREGYLAESEFEERLLTLTHLKAGKLRPIIPQ
jgi:hypothetical protein